MDLRKRVSKIESELQERRLCAEPHYIVTDSGKDAELKRKELKLKYGEDYEPVICIIKNYGDAALDQDMADHHKV